MYWCNNKRWFVDIYVRFLWPNDTPYIQLYMILYGYYIYIYLKYLYAMDLGQIIATRMIFQGVPTQRFAIYILS